MKKTNPGAALAAALLLALVAVSCDRDRSNPLDPQADFVQNRPEAPAQLVAEPGVGVIRLAWQGVTDRDLAGYALFRSERSNGTYAFVPGDGDSTAGITTGKVVFADSIHTQNRTFFYRIAAIDTAGLQSELTAFVGATALEDNIAPESPQSLSAVPDEDVLGRVVLRWSAPQKDSDGRDLSGLSGYVILRAEAGTGGVVPIDTLVAGIREFVDNDLKTLTTYSYSMVAFDVGGNTSRPATAVQVTTPGLPTPKSVNAADGIGRIVVTWGAVEDEALIGYDIYRSVSSEDGYVRLAGAEGRSFTTGRTTYIDSGLTGGALFFYRVRAVGRAGAASELSTFVSGEAQADEVPPGVPANLSAVPDAADFGRITVSWNVPQRDASGGVLTGLAGYAVFRSQETTDSFVRIATVTDPSFVDTGLDESTTFYYTVAAFDEKGNESGRASAVRVRTQGEDRIGPDAPVNVSAVADESTTGRIIVRWSAPTTDSDGQELTGLSGFVLFRSEGGPGSFVPADTVGADIRLWPDADLKSLTLYAYTVVAFDAAGNESRPATSSQTTTGGIPAPQGLAARDEIGRILIDWRPVDDSDLAGYNIYRSTRSDAGFVRLEGSEGADFTTGRTSYIDSNLTGGSLFFYKVLAVGTNGLLSELSAFVGGRALADESAPGAPRNVSAVADENDPGQITVGWSAPSTDASGDDLTGLSGFLLLRAEGSDGALLPVDTLAATLRTYVDSGLKALTVYRYAMVAFDASGNQSSQALSSSTRTAGIPTPVAVVAIEGLGRITLQWQAVDSDDLLGYDVYRATRSDGTYQILAAGEGSSFTTGRTSYIDSNLAGGTVLFYRVRAIGANNVASELSTFVSAQAAAGIPIPDALVAVEGLGRITLQWQAVDSDDLLGYDVYRATRSDGTYQIIAGGEGSPYTTGRTSYVDSNLAAGTLFFYKVRAIGTNNVVSELSTFVSAQAAADESAPAAPQNISVVPSGTDPTQITVRWTAPITDAGGRERTGLAGFRLLRAEGSGSFAPIATLAADIRQYDDSGLRSLTVYRYTLTAFDPAGNESGQSSTGQAQTIGVAIPGGVRASDGIGRIEITWSAVDADDLIGYNLYRSTRPDQTFTLLADDGGAAFTTGRTTFVDSSVTAGALFYYKVAAVTTSLQSERSAFVSGRAANDDVAPASPADIVAIADDAQALVSLSWTGSSVDQGGGDLTGLTSYIVFRGKGSAIALVALDTIDARTTSYADAALQAATTYYYAVSALDGSGNVSPRSSTVAATTQGIGAPLNVNAVGDVKSITVSWSASGEEDLLGYNVYRSARSDRDFSRLAGTEGTSFTTGQTAFIDSNLGGGQIRFYRVSVVTGSGESEPSSFDGATVQADTRAPAAPTFLDGEPNNGDPERLSLSWRAPGSDANGSSLTGVSLYRIYRSATSDGDFQEIATSSTTAYEDTLLDQRTTYYYQVEALDDDGNISPRSSTAAATTSGVDLPTNVRLVSSTPSDGAAPPVVTISWTKSAGAILRYEVSRATVANSTNDSDYTSVVPNSVTTSRTDNGVVRGTVYYYRVRAIDIDSRASDWTEVLAIAVAN
ncbi:MAG: hypothetical protein O2782_01290 [bacterium]|nr:hypothetical protein [bacterium]